MRFTILLTVLLNLGCFAEAGTKRWKGKAGNKISSTCLTTNLHGYLEDCVQACSLNPNCVAYHFNFDTKECCTAEVGFSSTTATGYALYQSVTTVNPPRPTVEHTPDPVVPECPVVYREWSQFKGNKTLGSWKFYSSSNEEPPSQMSDNSLDTAYKSYKGSKNSVTKIAFKRQIRVTSVLIVAGKLPIQSLDVRVGFTNIPIKGTSAVVYQNTRCSFYKGPSKKNNQEILLECGVATGIPGNWIYIQHIGTKQLEIAEVKIYGFGRICDVHREF